MAPGTIVEFTLVMDRQDGARRAGADSPRRERRAGPAGRAAAEAAEGHHQHAGEGTGHRRGGSGFHADRPDAARRVTLSRLRGRVVAINFIYTSCALPQFCFRTANQFGVLQKRFTPQLGRDVVFLTVTFDPVRDQPERLAEYAGQWKADPGAWHFLTGAVADIQRVCGLFGLDFFPDEGLINHSSRTADRRSTGTSRRQHRGQTVQRPSSSATCWTRHGGAELGTGRLKPPDGTRQRGH